MYLFGELLCTAGQLLVEAGHPLHVGLASEPGTVYDFEAASICISHSKRWDCGA